MTYLTNNELAAKIKAELLLVEHHVGKHRLEKLHKLLHRAETRLTTLGILEPEISTQSGGSGDPKPPADDPGIPG